MAAPYTALLSDRSRSGLNDDERRMPIHTVGGAKNSVTWCCSMRSRIPGGSGLYVITCVAAKCRKAPKNALSCALWYGGKA